VLVTVRDSGLGLPADASERIFGDTSTRASGPACDGTVDLATDHQSSRRTIGGERECAPGAIFQFTVPAAAGGNMAVGAP